MIKADLIETDLIKVGENKASHPFTRGDEFGKKENETK